MPSLSPLHPVRPGRAQSTNLTRRIRASAWYEDGVTDNAQVGEKREVLLGSESVFDQLNGIYEKEPFSY